MKGSNLLFAILFFIISNSAISQNRTYANKIVKKLKVTTPTNEGKVYVKAKSMKSGNIGVFLINRSAKDIEHFIGHSSHIEFSKEAIDQNGEWKIIDQEPTRYIICGMGVRHIKLQPDHYTWQKIYIKKYQGDYETEVRFTYKLRDSVILVSNPIKAKIDPVFFLPYPERLVHTLNLLLLSDSIPKTKQIRIQRNLISVYSRHKPVEETIVLLEKFVNEYPESLWGKYTLSRFYIRYIGKQQETLKKAETQTILSKVLSLIEQVPKEDELRYKRIQERKKIYHQLLLSKEEWLALDENQYENREGDFYARLLPSNVEKVKIRFKSD
ncbi:hypothetical protein FEE95_06535 [Maribacter algarum]|uniref:DUF4369 domain-containing protein n=1 Tax=Maribacter algarum (ex Zhang et al. 2020) TaxID=2578118 RepID=A0A5S3PVT8_9FLAO|nr:hypothetical protein [Maribacter algarum]TMM59085.1 hypothetical protein FEE95_06535 [Maribacter algarum]